MSWYKSLVCREVPHLHQSPPVLECEQPFGQSSPIVTSSPFRCNHVYTVHTVYYPSQVASCPSQQNPAMYYGLKMAIQYLYFRMYRFQNLINVTKVIHSQPDCTKKNHYTVYYLSQETSCPSQQKPAMYSLINWTLRWANLRSGSILVSLCKIGPDLRLRWAKVWTDSIKGDREDFFERRSSGECAAFPPSPCCLKHTPFQVDQPEGVGVIGLGVTSKHVLCNDSKRHVTPVAANHFSLSFETVPIATIMIGTTVT